MPEILFDKIFLEEEEIGEREFVLPELEIVEETDFLDESVDSGDDGQDERFGGADGIDYFDSLVAEELTDLRDTDMEIAVGVDSEGPVVAFGLREPGESRLIVIAPEMRWVGQQRREGAEHVGERVSGVGQVELRLYAVDDKRSGGGAWFVGQSVGERYLLRELHRKN